MARSHHPLNSAVDLELWAVRDAADTTRALAQAVRSPQPGSTTATRQRELSPARGSFVPNGILDTRESLSKRGTTGLRRVSSPFGMATGWRRSVSAASMSVDSAPISPLQNLRTTTVGRKLLRSRGAEGSFSGSLQTEGRLQLSLNKLALSQALRGPSEALRRKGDGWRSPLRARRQAADVRLFAAATRPKWDPWGMPGVMRLDALCTHNLHSPGKSR
jgi:hypothetical protein